MGEQIGGDSNVPRDLVVAVFPLEYIGPVYVQLRRLSGFCETTVHLLWGPWTYSRTQSIDERGVALMFAKTQRGEGQPPLRVVTDTPLVIEVYTGSPDDLPDDLTLDCNEGWIEG